MYLMKKIKIFVYLLTWIIAVGFTAHAELKLAGTIPADGSLLYSKSQQITITFSQAVNESSSTIDGAKYPGNYQLFGTGALGISVLSVTGSGAGPYVLNTSGPLNVGEVTVTINNIKSVSGDTFSGTVSFAFSVDTQSNVVVPARKNIGTYVLNQLNVDPLEVTPDSTSLVNVSFSLDIDKKRLSRLTNSNFVYWNENYILIEDQNQNTIDFVTGIQVIPVPASLPNTTTIQVSNSWNVQNRLDQTLTDGVYKLKVYSVLQRLKLSDGSLSRQGTTNVYTFDFNYDSTSPNVLSTIPAVDSSVNSDVSTVSIQFSESVLNSVDFNGALNIQNYILLGEGGEGLSISTITEVSESEYTLNLSGSLKEGSVSLTVKNIKDKLGIMMEQQELSWVVDKTQPQLVISIPESQQSINPNLNEISVTFDESVVNGSDLVNYSLSGTGLGSATISEILGSGLGPYILKLNGVFTNGNVQLTINNIQDDASNLLSETVLNYSVDTEKPTLTQTYPENGETINDREVLIQLWFSEPINNNSNDSLSIKNLNNFNLSGDASAGINVIAVSGEGLGPYHVMLSDALSDGTLTVTLNNVTDVSGNPFEFNPEFTFAIDTEVPQVVGLDPSVDQVLTDTNSTISFNVSKSILATSASNLQNYTLSGDSSANVQITDVIGSGSGPYQLVFDAPLKDGALNIQIQGLVDDVGNELEVFNAEYQVDVTGPEIISQYPTQFVSISSTSPIIKFSFNESVSASSVTNVSNYTFSGNGSNGVVVNSVTGSGVGPYEIEIDNSFIAGVIMLKIENITDLNGHVMDSKTIVFDINPTSLDIVSTVPEEGVLSSHVSSNLMVTFNTPVLNDGGSESVTNVSNYNLSGIGADGVSIISVQGFGAGPYELFLNQALKSGEVVLQVDNIKGSSGEEFSTVKEVSFLIDNDKPTVTQIKPFDENTINKTTSEIKLWFSEVVNIENGHVNSALNLSNYSLGGPASQNVTISAITGEGLGPYTLQLQGELLHGELQLTVVNIADAANNKLETVTFSAQVDAEGPLLQQSVPVANSVINNGDLIIEIYFNEIVNVNGVEAGSAVNPASYNLTGTGVLGASVVSVSGSGVGPYRLILSQPLVEGEVNLTVSGIQDELGNIMAVPAQVPFVVDESAPIILTSNPLQNEWVPITINSIQLTFNETVDSNSVLNLENYLLSGTGVGSKQILSISGSGAGPYTLSLTGAGLSGTFDLTVSNIQDEAGNKMNPYTLQMNFDQSRPIVLSTVPSNGTVVNTQTPVIEILFNKSMLETSLSSGVLHEAHYTFSGPGANQVQVTSVTGSGSGPYIIGLSGSFTEGEVFLEIVGVQDHLGNLIEDNQKVSFTVDTISPAIAYTTPTSGNFISTTVTELQIEFSEAVQETYADGGVYNTAHYHISGAGENGVSIISIIGSGKGPYTLTLSHQFSVGQVQLQVSGIKDYANNIMNSSTMIFEVNDLYNNLNIDAPKNKARLVLLNHNLSPSPYVPQLGSAQLNIELKMKSIMFANIDNADYEHYLETTTFILDNQLNLLREYTTNHTVASPLTFVDDFTHFNAINFWDGKNELGEFVGNGTYYYVYYTKFISHRLSRNSTSVKAVSEPINNTFEVNATRPSLVLNQPGLNETVNKNTQIQVTFNQEMNEASAGGGVKNPSNYLIQTSEGQNVQVQSITGFGVGPYTLELNTTLESSEVTVTLLQAIESVSGLSLLENISFTFNIDSTGPQVVSQIPLQNSVSGKTQTFSFNFSEQVNVSELGNGALNINNYQLLNNSSQSISLESISGSGSGPYVLRSMEELVQGQYALTISGVDDLYHNTMDPYLMNFSIDTSSPSVVNFLPANGTAISDETPTVQVYFSEPVASGTTGNGSKNPENYSISGTGSNGVVVTSVNGTGSGPYVLTLSGPLSNGRIDVGVLNVADQYGNIMTNTQNHYFYLNQTALSISSSYPVNGSYITDSNTNILMSFTNNMNDSDTGAGVRNPSNYLVSGSAGEGVFVLGVNGSGSGPYTFTFSKALSEGDLVIDVLNVEDVDGVPMLVGTKLNYIVDLSPPEVVQSSPFHLEKLNSNINQITVSFNEEMDEVHSQSIKNIQNVTLVNASQESITISEISGSGSGPYTISMTQNLSDGQYTLTVLPVRNKAGLIMLESKTIVFDINSNTPNVVSSNPLNDTTITESITSITLSFDKNLVESSGLDGVFNVSNYVFLGTASNGVTVSSITGSGSGPYTLNLNGEFASGQALLYINKVKDEYGNAFIGSVVSLRFFVDSDAPGIASSSPAHQSTTKEMNPQIGLTFSEVVLADESVNGALNINNYSVTGTGANGAQVLSVQGSGSGPYTLNLDRNLSEGTIIITAQNISDSNGVVMTSPNQIEFQIDLNALSILSSNPVDGSIVTTTEPSISVTFSKEVNESAGTIEGAKFVSNYQLTGEGASGVSVVAVSGSGSGPYTLTLSKELSQGLVQLNFLNIEDINGGVISVPNTIEFSVDSEAPIVTARTPELNDIMSVLAPTITVSFNENVVNATNINAYVITGSGSNGVSVTSIIGSGLGPYQLSLSGPFSAGEVNINANGIADEHGNITETVLISSFSVTDPLNIVQSVPASSSAISGSTTVSITFNKEVVNDSSDNGILNTNNFLISGSGSNGVSVSSVSGSGLGPYMLSFDDSFITGTVVLEVANIKSLDGVLMDTVSLTYSIDADSPNIMLLGPTPNSYVNTTQVNIFGQVTDDLSAVVMNSFELKVDGVIQNSLTINDNSFSKNVTVEEGVHLLNISVDDDKGNTAQQGYQFVVDTTSPALNINNPDSDGLIFTTTSPTFITQYSDTNIDITSLLVLLDNQPVSVSNATATGFEVVVSGVSSGSHTLYVEISDLAGNKHTQTRTFSVEIEDDNSGGGGGSNSTLVDWNLKTIASGINPQYVRIIDVNKDGKKDVIYKEINDGKIKVIYQQ